MQPDERLALANCEREPVHIPGRIQSTGALVAFELTTSKVSAYSENLLKMFPGIESVSIGMNYEGLFKCNEACHAIRGALELPSIWKQRERIGVLEFGGVRADFALFVVADNAVIELEYAASESEGPQTSASMARSMFSSLELGCGVQRLLDSAVKALRNLTGFDRVMAYRFLENGDGEVTAEACGDGIEPYLGLRYPASDIPQIVRQIALRSPIRLINHIDDEHVALITADPAVPLDLTLSHLRGVSPIHIEYLRNMGVSATMNTSIVVRGELWGLFAFHHYCKRNLSPDRRSICELLSQVVAMQVQIEEERELWAHRQKARDVIATLQDAKCSPQKGFCEIANELLNIVHADGAAFVEPDEITTFGTVPIDRSIRAICQLSHDDINVLDSLASTSLAAEDMPKETAGAMVLRVYQDVYLVLFRKQVIQEVRWAGGPEKTITYGPNGPRLSPRASFQEFRESVADRCKAWSHGDLTAATEVLRALMKLLLVSSIEISRMLEKQTMNAELAKTNLDLERSNTELERFAYIASHDLKAPLRAITGYLEFLKEDYEEQLDEQAFEYIAKGIDGAKRMNQLIEDLFHYSRILNYEADFRATDLNLCVSGALANLTTEIEETSATILVDPLPKVLGIESLLKQLFQNLIGNAIKYRSQLQPVIKIDGMVKSNQILIRVRDNGIGIAPEYRQKVFEIFRRLHNRKEYPGTGIGLAVCERVMERHDGSISIETNEDDQGCCFVMRFPLSSGTE